MERVCGECGLPRGHWVHANPSLGPRQLLHKYVIAAAARPLLAAIDGAPADV